MRPFGLYMAKVYSGEYVLLQRIFGSLERFIYRIGGISPNREMNWKEYARAIFALAALGILLTVAILMGQFYLPLNPQSYAGIPLLQSLNIAVSFATDTNWQNYAGETTLSYFSQMFGCTVQNFLSAASGMAVATAMFRGLSRKHMECIGNAYADVVRGILYILLPLSFVFSLALASQGVIQNFDAAVEFTTMESAKSMKIPQGPVASLEAIKMLGSNGPGFFSANSAHPYENPSDITNVIELIIMWLIPIGFLYTYGVMIADTRQGLLLLAVMSVMFMPFMMVVIDQERHANIHISRDHVDVTSGNMEGKEIRFNAYGSAAWAASTAATSNGSVNSMHASYMPLGGAVPLLICQLGGMIFGGVGSGVYTMLMFVILTVFIGGLMIGRTPEFMGKKIESYEIKMASLGTFAPSVFVLVGTAVALSFEQGRQAISEHGTHGFTEVLYAFTSAANTNGSAFSGIKSNNDFYNIALMLAMLVGRYLVMYCVLAIAGAMANKNAIPIENTMLKTHTPLFGIMLIAIIMLFGLLTFMPALVLGPVAGHVNMIYVSGAAP